MSISDQEERELAHLLAFKEAHPSFPEGEIPREGRNSKPDFRVVSPEHVVGVEHTEIYHEQSGRGIPQQARETYTERITQRAQEIYQSGNNPPVWVWPHFTTNAQLGTDNVEELAEDLAEIVEHNLPEKNSSVELKQSWSPDDPLPRQFSVIQILRYGDVQQPWFPPMAGAEPEVPTSYIQERIQDKNTKITEYRDRCDHIWLLLVVDGSRPSTFFDIAGEALDNVYESRFDQTYLFDFQRKQVHELKTVTEKH